MWNRNQGYNMQLSHARPPRGSQRWGPVRAQPPHPSTCMYSLGTQLSSPGSICSWGSQLLSMWESKTGVQTPPALSPAGREAPGTLSWGNESSLVSNHTRCPSNVSIRRQCKLRLHALGKGTWADRHSRNVCKAHSRKHAVACAPPWCSPEEQEGCWLLMSWRCSLKACAVSFKLQQRNLQCYIKH